MSCGCQSACGCSVIAGAGGITVSRVGDTFVVSYGGIVVTSVDTTGCVPLSFAAGVIGASLLLDPAPSSVALTCGIGGLSAALVIDNSLGNGGVDLIYGATGVYANLIIDPAGSAPVSVGPLGLKVDCCPASAPAIQDTDTIDMDDTLGILSAEVIPNTLAGLENQANGVSIKLEDDPAAIAAIAGNNLARFTAAGDLTVHGNDVAGFVGAHARAVTAGSPVSLSNTVGVQSSNSFSAVITNPTAVAMIVRLEGIAHLESVTSGAVGTNRIWSQQCVLDVVAVAGGANDIGSNGLYTVTEFNSNVVAAGVIRIDRSHLAKWAYIPPGGSVTFASYQQPLLVAAGWTTALAGGASYTFENVELAIFPAKTGGWAL